MRVFSLIGQAWETFWQRRVFLLLGIIAALTTGANGSWPWRLRSLLRTSHTPAPLAAAGSALIQAAPIEGVQAAASDMGRQAFISAAIALLVILCVAALALLIVVGVVGLFTAGALIAGTASGSRGSNASVNEMLRSGWRSAWRLILIASIPPIPVLIGGIGTLIGTALYLRSTTAPGDVDGMLRLLIGSRGLHSTLLAANTLPVLLSASLFFLQGLAMRACVLNGASPTEAYRLAWRTLWRRPGLWALMLAIIGVLRSLILGLFLGAALILPWGLLYRPFALLISGAGFAFFSICWTLAWLDLNPETGQLSA